MAGPGVSRIGPEEEAELLSVIRERELSRYRFDDHDGSALPSKVSQFEQEFRTLTGARHCLGMNSCTSALYAGLLAAGIGPGDEVIVPGYTFIASIAAVAHTGAEPVLAEIDESLLLDPADVAAKITSRTKAVLAVHMLGAPCDLDALDAVTREHGLLLVEDCAQAGGGTYRGRHLGTVGGFGAFSLNVFKTFTAGDGGVLLTDDDDLYETAFALHDHGAAPLRLGVTDGPPLFGLNLRMHELTGALALAQVRKLPDILRTLRANRDKFADAIGDLPGVAPRRLHDPDGDCATVLAYTFASAAIADEVAGRLGTITLSRSGKHNYANMPQLRPDLLGSPDAATRRPNRSVLRRSYPPGSLPRTDDLLSRSIALSVGVVDSYLGSGVGIDVMADDDTIEAAARQFRTTVEDVAKAAS
ncbi:DegT/DnrJ/EryC1/StrS family aminotransferase [Streptomyces sp. NBC_01431]|uniref:DegT/DnrJ/EryC1/StrS family aminotransferase n=1 Tax=Streptomyces sp. NBC_01431 TaxID=2903863 RepID=UPI002E330C2C|nr:DegT/DnrJ/EryC1/StrS family aminotransferase [Streptomyces sp. NBC_01431]